MLHVRAGEYYLMDGTNGLRFIPNAALQLQPGDQVEAVGFPELEGPSPNTAPMAGSARWRSPRG